MEKSRVTSSVGILIALAMGAFGLYAVSASKTGADQEKTPAEGQHKTNADAGSATSSAESQHAWHLLMAGQRLADVVPDAPEDQRRPLHPLWEYAATGLDAHETEDWLKKADSFKSAKKNCLIATVPDPLDTDFGFAFDQVIEAIQEAVETPGQGDNGGYVFEGYWLPWDLDRRTLSSHEANAAGVESAPVSDEFPGTLLFRRSSKPPPMGGAPGDAPLSRPCEYDDLFVVFLVGEAPTAGIDKRSFAQALRLIGEYHLSPDGERIAVLGPYFSGSQTSLQMAVNSCGDVPGDGAEQGKASQFRIISGSATSVDKRHLFRDKSKANFRATVIPSTVTLQACLHYLGMRDASKSSDYDLMSGWPNKPIAILSEFGTDFGNSAAAATPDAAGNPPSGGARQAKDKPATEPPTEPPTRQDSWHLTEMHFPPHISRLKADYEKQKQKQEQRLGLDSVPQLIPRLDIGAESEADKVPAQDPSTTAASNAKVLDTITAVLTRDNVQYVGIVATDPRDKIFLASWIGEHCPGVQIFVIESDNMLALPEFAYYLKGTIVGSTYPLIPANQSWTDPWDLSAQGTAQKKRLSFPSQSAQGYYNACLALMWKPEAMAEYRTPWFDGGDHVASKPPVWITMIGQNGKFVPLQVFSNYPDELGYLYPSDEKRLALAEATAFSLGASPVVQAPLLAGAVLVAASRPEARPTATVSAKFPATPLIGLTVICCFCGWVVYRALRNPSPLALFWNVGDPQPPVRREDVAYRAVCLLSLSFVLVPLAVLGWIHQQTAHPEASHDWWTGLLSWTLWLLAGAPAVLLVFVVWALAAPVVASLRPKPGITLKRSLLHCSLPAVLLALLFGLPVVGKVLLAPAGLAPNTGGPSETPTLQALILLVFVAPALLPPVCYRLWAGPADTPPKEQTFGVSSCIVCAALVVTAAFCAIVIYLQHTTSPLTSWSALFFERALDLASGVSPLLPLVFLSTAFFVWSYFKLKSAFFFLNFRIPNAYPSEEQYGGRPAGVPIRSIEVLHGKLDDDVGHVRRLVANHWPAFLLVALGAVVTACRLIELYHRVIEGFPWDCLFLGGFLIACLLNVVNLMRLIFLWSLLKKLLHQIAVVPMVRAFDRLPDAVTKAFGGYFFGHKPHFAQLHLPIHQLGLIAAAGRELTAPRPDGTPGTFPGPGVVDLMADKAEALKLQLEDEAKNKQRMDQEAALVGRMSVEAKESVQAFAHKCILLLSKGWPAIPVKEVFSAGGASDSDKSAGSDAKTAPKKPRTPQDQRAVAEADWAKALEDFVACHVVVYLSQYMTQLRNLVWSLTACSCLLYLAVSSYPFHPEHLMLYLLLGLIGCILAAILYVLTQMNLNEVLSRIAKTAPNRFTLDPGFVGSFFTYVVPTVGVIALQWSGAFRFMIEPILRVLR
jgi:hypothetical protein